MLQFNDAAMVDVLVVLVVDVGVQFLDTVVDLPVVVQVVQKTVEVPQLQFSDKVVTRCCERQVLGGAAGAVPLVMNIAVIMQRQVGVSRTVEVPQIQFIAPFEDTPIAQQRRAGTVQNVQFSALGAFYGGYGGDELVFRPF